ncbi:zf-C3HC-domain-containing protein [Serendipita vermifera]|nr:zf-C3HC-domain-containing protein [Serendipita vermifera]
MSSPPLDNTAIASSAAVSTPKRLPVANTHPTASSLNKRKYEDALSLLDEAAGTRSMPTIESTPPPKRARTNLYSTLAKYGIGTSVDHKSSSLSNLQRVLKLAKAAPADSSASSVSGKGSSKYSTYDPTSRTEFLARLQTFKLMTYSSKPPDIDAVAAARCGWYNEGGKEVLTCKTCSAVWTMPPRNTSNKEELSTLIEKQKAMLIEQHNTSCPWRVRQSEASIYSMPIPSPSALSSTVLQRAGVLQPLVYQIGIKHPLSIQQISILVSAVESAQADMIRKRVGGESGNPVDLTSLPGETAIIIAFFGWDRSLPASSNSAKSNSVAGSLIPTPSQSGTATPNISSGKAIVTCQLCQRQVGLWSFGAASSQSILPPSTPGRPTPTQRHFDVLREHRPHCPYVVKSTYLPTAPMLNRDMVSSSTPSPDNKGTLRSSDSKNLLQPLPFVEGWRVLMSVISRSQWRKASTQSLVAKMLPPSSPATPQDERGPTLEATSSQEIDEVTEIVKDVKSRHGGGRDLLRFVKGLLG